MGIRTKSEAETRKYGEKIGKNLKVSKVLGLYGDLGSGKTTFVQGLARGLGIKNRIISPTFVILRSYRGKNFNLHHIDLYRIKSERQVADLGILDLFEDPKNVIAIEWAENLGHFLPKNALKFTFQYTKDGRKIKLDETKL